MSKVAQELLDSVLKLSDEEKDQVIAIGPEHILAAGLQHRIVGRRVWSSARGPLQQDQPPVALPSFWLSCAIRETHGRNKFLLKGRLDRDRRADLAGNDQI